MIEEEAQKVQGDYSKIILGGVSQGCSVALQTALTAPYTLGGVIGLSGLALP